MTQKRIIIIISDLGSGGAQKIATSLAAYIIKQGHHSNFIILGSDTQTFFDPPPESQVTYLNLNNASQTLFHAIWNNINRVFALRQTLKRAESDAIISFIAPTNILTILANIGLPGKVIISERNDPSRQSFGGFWDFLRKRLYRFADLVTCNTTHATTIMEEYVPKNKITYIPNQLKIPTTESIPKIQVRDNIILTVGRLHSQKSYHTLLDAFAQIHADWTEWRIIMVGDGALKSTLQKQAQDRDIHDKVSFEGAVKDPQSYYARAKIFALPSLHEGTPNALLEAMSYGCIPVISNTIEGFQNIISGDQCFQTNDANALAGTLTKLISQSAAEQQTLSDHAHNAIKPFSEDIVFSQWNQIIERVT